MDSWDEIRTAYQVAKLGTVSGAAEVLSVHHATVIRHVDALEARLGAKLFQRHARGYTPTEAGHDLLKVAQTTSDQFTQLAGRIKGQGESVSGELVVTSLASLAPQLVPVLVGFQKKHPDVRLRFLTGDRLFRLEYGEAHVAIRAGRAPDEPDNVVQKLMTRKTGLYASKDYIDAHGAPKTEEELSAHLFVVKETAGNVAPFYEWLNERVPAENFVFVAADTQSRELAVACGVGLGFMTAHSAARYPDLVEVMPPRSEWDAPLWIVTHVDLHRTLKVQTFLKHLKSAAEDWSAA